MKDFDEKKHPRDKNGKFTVGKNKEDIVLNEIEEKKNSGKNKAKQNKQKENEAEKDPASYNKVTHTKEKLAQLLKEYKGIKVKAKAKNIKDPDGSAYAKSE